jgi:hypothetical protein
MRTVLLIFPITVAAAAAIYAVFELMAWRAMRHRRDSEIARLHAANHAVMGSLQKTHFEVEELRQSFREVRCAKCDRCGAVRVGRFCSRCGFQLATGHG